MINSSDISLQRILEIENDISVLKKMLYDLDGKCLRNKTVNGDTVTGGVIEGSLLQTSNTSNYIKLHEQYIEIYHNGIKTMEIGHSDSSLAAPTIRLYSNGNQRGSIVGDSDSLTITGNTRLDINAPVIYVNGVMQSW